MDFLNPKPFTPYKLEEDRKGGKGRTFTIWMSDEEYAWLQDQKKLIRQPKDSTALKQLARIGANMLGRPEMTYAIDTLFKNNRKNERLGIGPIG